MESKDVDNVIKLEKVKKYFQVTGDAIEKIKVSKNRTTLISERKDFLVMINCYYSDATHFFEKGDYINAFAALNYAHGWIDSGARLGIFDVHDSVLFTVDDE